jgi:hypothetical protein
MSQIIALMRTGRQCWLGRRQCLLGMWCQRLKGNWARYSTWRRDERGLEALQTVMIVAIAAVCLLVLKSYWPGIRDWFNTLIEVVIE